MQIMIGHGLQKVYEKRFGAKDFKKKSFEPKTDVNGRYSLRQNDSDEKLVHFLVPRATTWLLQRPDFSWDSMEKFHCAATFRN